LLGISFSKLPMSICSLFMSKGREISSTFASTLEEIPVGTGETADPGAGCSGGDDIGDIESIPLVVLFEDVPDLLTDLGRDALETEAKKWMLQLGWWITNNITCINQQAQEKVS